MEESMATGTRTPMATGTRTSMVTIQSPVSRHASRMDRDDARVIVHREAALRRGEAYLIKTQSYLKAGLVPPVQLDEEVQAEALEWNGFSADASTVAEYQAIVRSFPRDIRQKVFFLDANDRFFHPEVGAANLPLAGPAFDLDGNAATLDTWLVRAQTAGRSKIFLVASTST